MAETPLGKKVITAIEALETLGLAVQGAINAAKDLKDQLATKDECQDDGQKPPEQPA
jgi:hypothetical protein